MRYLLILCVLIAATASVATFQRSPYVALNRGDTTTCHSFDSAKLTIVEKKLSDGAVVWRVMRDDGLIMGHLSTKSEAEAALAAMKKFKAMCVIGNDPNRFVYFE